MQFFLVFLFFSLFIFLFCLYWMGRDDLVLLRKNIALEQLFNITFLALGIGMFSARLWYVLLHLHPKYLNPLVFLVFPYFPGLSLFGGMIGVVGFLFYLMYTQKLPLGRVLDFYSLSLLVSLPFGLIGQMFISPRNEIVLLFVLSLIYVFIAAIFFSFFYPKTMQTNFKEGTISILFVLTFSFISLSESIIMRVHGFWLFFGIEQIIMIILFLGSLVLLIKREQIIKKRK